MRGEGAEGRARERTNLSTARQTSSVPSVDGAFKDPRGEEQAEGGEVDKPAVNQTRGVSV